MHEVPNFRRNRDGKRGTGAPHALGVRGGNEGLKYYSGCHLHLIAKKPGKKGYQLPNAREKKLRHKKDYRVATHPREKVAIRF